MNYYNEFDPKAAAWLRELVAAKLIPDGKIDQRSINDVTPNDLAGFDQCHFFAGIGGWAYALQLAGWPSDRPAWTGSCPCQPFSDAGKGLGTADPRHLWPVFFRLIEKCGPPVVFGEQVASGAALGWLDGVFADLEGAGYACAAADLCAAGVGAPHIRQRLFWVSDRTLDGRRQGDSDDCRGVDRSDAQGRSPGFIANGDAGGLSDGQGKRWVRGQAASGTRGRRVTENGGDACGLSDSEGGRARSGEQSGRRDVNERDGEARRLPDMLQPGLEGQPRHGDDRHEPGRDGADAARPTAAGGAVGGESDAIGIGRNAVRVNNAGNDRAITDAANAWSNFDILPFRDGKARRVEAGTFPLAHGIPGRVGLLRGYGNAIVPPVAAEFIKAYIETLI